MKRLVAILMLFTSPALAEKPFVFDSDGTEFSVRFPEKPTIVPSRMKHPSGQEIALTRAELKLNADQAFLRAELIPITPGSADSMTDEEMMAQALAYAEYNGMVYPEVAMLPSSLGRCVSFRAFKDIDGVKVTYENRVCYAERSMVALYAGAKSKNYPPSSVVAFFKSLKRE
jgi:hypothetical protein